MKKKKKKKTGYKYEIDMMYVVRVFTGSGDDGSRR